MFHKLNHVVPLEDYRLLAQFVEGVSKIYDVKPVFDEIPVFQQLKENDLFEKAHVGPGGYGVIWNDEIDLSCEELFYGGTDIATPFDGLVAFVEATRMWGLNESTLRKAIAYGKLKAGVDAGKYGKQWVVSTEAMRREYGEPKYA